MQETKQPAKAGYWRTATGEMKRIGSLAGAGVLAALGIVLKSLTITFGQLFRFGFSFLTTALSGFLYGPVVAGFMAMVVDVLGFLVNPTGPYFFGFTFNAFLGGFIYGCWLYRKKVTLWRCLAAAATHMVVISFLLNPLWLHIMYGEAWQGLVLMRIPANAVVLPVNTLVLYFLLRVVEKQLPHINKSSHRANNAKNGQ